jgi:hypothetical protein
MEDYLTSLSPPTPGYIRVFPGQARHYPTLVPSALRNPSNLETRRFRAYCVSLANRLRENYSDVVLDIDIWTIWTLALAQHYSLGSPYLDVTKDVEVALWFATHRPAVQLEPLLIGPPGHYNPLTDFWLKLELTTLSSSLEPTGYLYVFDVPVWDGNGHPRSGQLIDLSRAPQVFASSRRMLAQSGCLVHADRRQDGGDLSRLLACPPIEVPTSISGRCTTIRTGELFPPPSEDHWYEAFVATPLSFATKDGQHLEPRPSIPLTLFFDTANELADLNQLVTLLANPLLGLFLRREQHRGASWLPPDVFPDNATTIIVDVPLYLVTPPLGDQWNEAVAMTGVPTTARVANPAAGDPDAVPLEKVLVEFSVLEHPIWRGLEADGETKTIVRALYVARRENEFAVWEFSQDVPIGPVTCVGPIPADV